VKVLKAKKCPYQIAQDETKMVILAI